MKILRFGEMKNLVGEKKNCAFNGIKLDRGSD
jgi:hypothetical protein